MSFFMGCWEWFVRTVERIVPKVPNPAQPANADLDDRGKTLKLLADGKVEIGTVYTGQVFDLVKSIPPVQAKQTEHG